MEYILLFAVIILGAFQTISRKYYLVKSKYQNNFSISGIIAITAMLYFAVIAKFQFDFNIKFVPYSIAFALSYGAASVGAMFAVKYGSFSISSLVVSYALIIPTFYGIFVYHDPLTWIGYAGFVLLCASLFMIREKEKVKSKVTTKWIISIIVSFAGNGLCSLFQKIQQMDFNGGYKSEFMIVALFLCASLNFIIATINKEKLLPDLKLCLPIGVSVGIANGIVNYLVMVLSATIPNAILFPSISAGGLVLTFIAGVTIYKEKFSKMQNIGYAIGVISLILLNL